MKRQRALAIFLLTGFLLTSCHALIEGRTETKEGKDSPSQPFTLVRDPQLYLSIQGFNSCDVVLSSLREQTLQFVEDSIQQQRHDLEQALQRQDDGQGSPTVDKAASNEMGDSASNAESSSGPEDFTKTNTQVEGVDEADIVKTDGTHIYALSGNTVQIVKSWPAIEMTRLAVIAIEGLARDMFLTDDKRLIVSYHPTYVGPQPNQVEWYPPYNYDHQMLGITVYDVSVPTSPVLMKKWMFSGDYISSRRIGNTVRLVQSQWNVWPEGIDWYIPIWDYQQNRVYGGYITLEEFDRRAESVRSNIREIVNTRQLADFLGSQQASDDIVLNPSQNCQQIYAPKKMEQLGMTKITSLNLETLNISQSAILVPSNLIYASQDSLYVTSSAHWFWSDLNDWFSRTFVHRFSISDPSQVAYLGSGSVKGSLLNQFSMDEFQGVLRLAVTQEQPITGTEAQNQSWWNRVTVNRVITMGLDNQQLTQLGETEALAEGERIYSTRFQGNKAFVVTFRQVDPLFTFDLTDPANPKVLGALKIPGVSNYIHMLDDFHLLTVGQDGNENGLSGALKISIFDVSDMANPKEKHSLVVGQGNWSWSEAQYDHKAFTFFRSRGLLGIPIGGYRPINGGGWWESYFSELMVFHIDSTAGISQRGAIQMNDLYQSRQLDWYDWWYGANVRRSVFADDIIYSISNFGIKAVNNSNLETPIQTVSFW